MMVVPRYTVEIWHKVSSPSNTFVFLYYCTQVGSSLERRIEKRLKTSYTGISE